MIHCEIEHDLSWSKSYIIRLIPKCIISEISITPSVVDDPDANPPVQPEVAKQTTGATFQINKAKLYVPVLTLSINDNVNFLENLKEGFKRTISWIKYWLEITIQSKNINLDYLIDPTFKNINRLFVLSFKNGDDDPTRNSFEEYYMLLAEIKDFNGLIGNNQFFDQPVKNKQKP